MVRFTVPDMADQPEGWGPALAAVPPSLEGVPYAPYNKSERIGRAADFTQQGYKYGRYDRGGGGVNHAFNFFEDPEDKEFHLIDSGPKTKRDFRPRRFQRNRRDQQATDRDLNPSGLDRERVRRMRQQQKQRQWQSSYWNQREQAVRINHTASVEVRPDWLVLDQIDMSALAKLVYNVQEPETLIRAGKLVHYNKTYDKITVRMEKRISKFENRKFFKVTTSEDPIIQRLVKEGSGNVYATDVILSTIMCAPRSNYGWDIMVEKRDGNIFLDKRPSSALDLLTVSETAQEPIVDEKEGINSIERLSQEATVVNQNFSQQVLSVKGEAIKLEEDNPFADDSEDIAPVAYKYRKWKLGDDVTLIARTEVDCLATQKDEDVEVQLRALNEYDPKATGVDYRKKIESQRGAVLATELKNNNNKLAKWTAQALLAGAGLMKIGFVTRTLPRDPFKHVLVGTHTFKPKDFATQMNLTIPNMWGILKAFIDMFRELEDGHYLLLRDPNKPLMRLYKIPADAFAGEEEEDAEREVEEDGDVEATPLPNAEREDDD